MSLTMKEIREKKIKKYYKVVLFDEQFQELDEVIGRFEDIKEAKKEARRFTDEEIDGESGVDIFQYYYDKERDAYILNPHFETLF